MAGDGRGRSGVLLGRIDATWTPRADKMKGSEKGVDLHANGNKLSVAGF